MKYSEFESIFNRAVFEKSKAALLKAIAEHPQRYVGLFRPTGPRTKVIQNLLQSHEIKFGDAFEEATTKYLEQVGHTILDVNFKKPNGKKLKLDQVFSNGDGVFFVEQKIRDDHDSSKWRGQISNFEAKIRAVAERHSDKKISGFFYFVDESFHKNKKEYEPAINKLSKKYNMPLHLWYGRKLFDEFGMSEQWDELLDHLTQWRKTIPELPNLNFDKISEGNFAQIKELPNSVFRKLFSNEAIDPVLRVLFPRQTTLKKLANHFELQHQEAKHAAKRAACKELHKLCTDTITRLQKNPLTAT